MPTQFDTEIKNRIQSFVQELDVLVRRSTLDALRGILDNGTASARRGRPAGARRGPGRPRGSGRSADLDGASQAIVAHVSANDGQGISTIADATGVDLKTAKKAAIQLLASGQLKKSGARRGTVYHVGSGRPARAAKAGKRRGKKRGRKAKAA
jgi:hypothetical protein